MWWALSSSSLVGSWRSEDDILIFENVWFVTNFEIPVLGVSKIVEKVKNFYRFLFFLRQFFLKFFKFLTCANSRSGLPPLDKKYATKYLQILKNDEQYDCDNLNSWNQVHSFISKITLCFYPESCAQCAVNFYAIHSCLGLGTFYADDTQPRKRRSVSQLRSTLPKYCMLP